MNKSTFEISGDTELVALLNRIPAIMAATGGPTDRAIGKAGTVVARRARQIVPDSRKNPKGDSRAKQSAKSKKDWQYKLREQITKKVVKYESTAVAVVGAQDPQGNAAHFMQEKGRRLVLWGKATMVALYRIQRNWITQAVEETRDEQRQAIVESLKTDLDKVMSGN